MRSYRQRVLWIIVLPGVLAFAADQSWKLKPIREWTEVEARAILTDSPWAKNTTATIGRLLTEDERREGGQMGQAHGVGFDAVDGDRTKPTLLETLHGGSGGVDKRRTSHPTAVTVRWESTLPVRAAELKAGVVEPPTLDGDGYRIAVYGLPGGYFKQDPKTLGDPLKKSASLKRDGKKDAKPVSVEVFQREDGLAVVYLFPLSAEIGSRDSVVEFSAQIGRIAVAQKFQVAEMFFEGRLEL